MKKFQRYANRGIASLLIWGGLAGLAAIGGVFGFKTIGGAVAGDIAAGMAGFLNYLLPFVGQIFQWLGGLAANLINIFAVMNPFDASTLAPFIWNTFKNIAYVVLIFLGLYSGFMYIVGRDDEAKTIIFKILVIAFLINFTFLIAKEIFFVSFVITKNLACQFEGVPPGGNSLPCSSAIGSNEEGGRGSKIGTAIHTSLLSFVNPENAKDLANLLPQNIDPSGDRDAELMQHMYALFGNLVVLVLYFVYTTIMFIFAGLFVGRFVMVTFLVGLLPLAVIAWAIPKSGQKWADWSEAFLKWTINIPALLILVLIGFSIVSVGLSGNNFLDKFARFGDARLVGEQQGNLPQAYAGLLRYFFIVAYYAFVINYAQKLGGGFATFGVNFAKGSYLAMGGTVAGAGKAGFKPIRAGIGEKVETFGDKLAGSGVAGTYNIGKQMRSLGESMQKGKKEREEEIAKGKIAQIKSDPKKIRDYMQELTKSKKYGTLKHIIDSDKIDWDNEEWIKQVAQMPSILSDSKARVFLSKKWKGFNAIDENKMAEALSSIDIPTAGGWSEVSKIVGQLKYKDPSTGIETAFKPDDVLQKTWTSMSSTKQQRFAASSEHFDKALSLGIETDPDFVRGFVNMPSLRPVMKAGLGQILNSISQGRLSDAQTLWTKLSPAILPAATAMPTSEKPSLSIKTYIDGILNRLTPPSSITW